MHILYGPLKNDAWGQGKYIGKNYIVVQVEENKQELRKKP